MTVRMALPERYREAVSAGLPEDAEVAWYGDGRDAPGAVGGAEILWLNMWRPEEIEAALAAGPQLRWVSSHGAGMDSMPLARFRERGIALTNGAGLHAIPIAEYVCMAMLAFAKGLPELVRAQDRGEWLSSAPRSGELYGSRALIVGYGQIGRAVGERLRAFGVEVVGVRRRPQGEPGVIGPGDWRALLGGFDLVLVAAPLTAGTRHLLGAPELAAMKPGAWVGNVARGSLIDPRALLAALTEGHLGGAYLDVTEPEPLPADSPLWVMPNVLVSPHSSAATDHLGERAAALFLDNLARYRAGRPLRNLVDLDAGY